MARKCFSPLLLTVGVAAPIMHLAFPEGSALHLSTYTMTLIGKYMTYALLAIAVDLVWGYCGILSLGHAAFFALGGYAMGMYLMRQIGTRGVYGDPVLPDFMVFLNWKELPWFWHGFDMFWFAALMVIVVPGLLALMFGWLAFRSRVTGVYLSIITQALTYALMLAFFRNDMGFGGNNGLTDFKDILGCQYQRARHASVACSSLRPWRWRSAISHAAISRCRAPGASCRRFAMPKAARASSAIASSRTSCGCLYSPPCSPVSPARCMCRRSASSIPVNSQPINSIEIVIWVAVGGRGTLYGAVAGAVLVNYAKTYFTAAMPGALALRAGRAVRARHAVPAARRRRAGRSLRPGDRPRRTVTA